MSRNTGHRILSSPHSFSLTSKPKPPRNLSFSYDQRVPVSGTARARGQEAWLDHFILRRLLHFQRQSSKRFMSTAVSTVTRPPVLTHSEGSSSRRCTASSHLHTVASQNATDRTSKYIPLTMEQRIRNRSARITSLPKWRAKAASSPSSTEIVTLSKAKPDHPSLLALFQIRAPELPLQNVDQAVKVYQDHNSNDLTAKDFMFVLETIQDHSTSQEQFWQSMVVLIRSSTVSHRQAVQFTNSNSPGKSLDWNRIIASALSRPYWNQKEDCFLEQVLHAKEQDEALARKYQAAQRIEGTKHQVGDQVEQQVDQQSQQKDHRRLFPPFMASHEIMAITMVESLLLKYHSAYALQLFERLHTAGVQMPGRLISGFIRVAIESGDGDQLEKIGMLLISKPQYSPAKSEQPSLILSSKLMDSFVHGACEHELFDLAREVFDKGLEAGGQYRVQTFTRILNSLSVKGFGFDVVNAGAVAGKRHKREGKGKTSQIKGGNTSKASLAHTNRQDKSISVADPQEVEQYIAKMEQLSILPTITTLNVLVKLYLEMAQYRVPGAPSWTTAFRRYNPQGLVPDVVTNNILLAYYERHKDLTTMLKIYNDMAGALDDGEMAGGQLRRRKKTRATNINTPEQEAALQQPALEQPMQALNSDSSTTVTTEQGSDPMLTPLQLEQMREQEELQRQEEQIEQEKLARQRQRRVRSQRDIYTYNTMLHALLQHAVDSKDIAAIGQCFHDMEQDGISADTVTFNTNILYHIASGDLASAVQVFRSMNATATASSKDAQGTKYWNQGPSKPIKSNPSYKHSLLHASSDAPQAPITTGANVAPVPDVVSLTSMISGFGQAKIMDQASMYFREMTEKFEIAPNFKTYSTLMAGLHRSGDHERAERLWDIVLKEDERVGQEGKPQHDADGDEMDGEPLAGQGRSRRRLLTVTERRQIEARRKMLRESLVD
ncbi:hypothetical protein BGZ94_003294 [Podila epigama]|nr:hypothetical protein BGZ94_003294 [Podila epigama]